MRISTLEFFNRGLSGFLRQQEQVSDAQVRLSVGKNILKSSDDPVGSTRSITLRQSMQTIEQYISNGAQANTNLYMEDNILQATNTVLHRVKELTVQSGNHALTSSDRETIAIELTELLDELVGLANTKNTNGEYIFSGAKGKTKPVIINSLGQYHYQGDENQKTTKLSASTFTAVSDTAKSLFFNVSSDDINSTGVLGRAELVSTGSGLVATGSLTTLDLNDLKINNRLVPPATSDGVSSTDATASAIAIANAINSVSEQHNVVAHANPNIVNLGTITQANIASGEFTLNGIPVVDATGTESSIISTLQSLESQTGVQVSQPGGVGTDIILTASDGRNIQLQTIGGATANFSNFDLSGVAQDLVQQSTFTLYDHSAFTIGGANPGDFGFSAGPVSLSNNVGTGVVQSVNVYTLDANPDLNYTIEFNPDGTTFNIVSSDSPLTPLAGYENVTYTPGTDIEFEGIRVVLSGAPAAGDKFGIDLSRQQNQDIFTSLQNLITNIRSLGNDHERLSYEVGLALSNLTHAETNILEIRAKVGARLNVVDNQRDVHERTSLLIQENLSIIEDLDYAKAITELSQHTFTLEAAQQSYMRIQRLSIFNYI